MAGRPARRRRRRLLAVGAAAAATVLVVVGVATAASRDGAATPAGTVDALDAAALTTMRTALSSAVPVADRQTTEVVPLGPDGITPVDLPSATGVASAYAAVRDGEQREWRLFAAVDGAPGDPGDDGCSVTLPALSCTVAETDAGRLTTERFVSVRRTDAGPDRYELADPAEVRLAELSDLRVEQVVRLHLPGGGRISAWETVHGVAGPDVASVANDDEALAALVRTPELIAALTGEGR
ncbi:hypothetical protein CCO04_13775 [Pimelobacter sp. 30-1]|nr:hypothetical protein [Pimelobacter sp. 30-1]